MEYGIRMSPRGQLFENWWNCFDGKKCLESIDGIVIPSYLPPKKKIINFQGMVSWVSLKNLRVSLRFPKLRGLICFTRRLWTHTRRAGCNCHSAQWYYRGTFCGQLLSWWFRNSANKLRLVVYPIIYDGFYASQVVVWDFWTTNRIRGMMYHLGNI